MKDMKDILKLGLILLIITSVSAFSLSFTNMMTKERIDAHLQQQKYQAMFDLIGEAKKFDEVKTEIKDQIKEKYPRAEAFEGTADGKTVGFVIKTVTKGYGGEVQTMVAITTDNKLAGYQVVTHQETAGLGSKITESPFKDQFPGLNIKEKLNSVKGTPNRDKNEIQALSGATVSTGAVVSAVNEAREIYFQFLSSEKIDVGGEMDPLKAAQEILPETTEIIDLSEDFVKKVKEAQKEVDGVYVAAKDGKVLGFVVRTLTSGYSDEAKVEIFTVIGNDGVIAGMRLGKNKETGGLGTRIGEEEHTNQFKGIDVNKELVSVPAGTSAKNNEINAITGATLSSEGAVKGVNAARQVYLNFIAGGKLTINLHGGIIKDLADSLTPIDANKLKAIKAEYPMVDEILVAKSGQQVAGYVIKTIKEGYYPNMEVLTAIKADGTIYNVALGFNHETSGLGSKVGEEAFASQFKGMKINNKITVVASGANKANNEVDQVTAATFSSNGFAGGVNNSMEVFNKFLK